ncbi:MAG TPA: EAL domain-containing protein, partial [Novosphingobium sp.]|nr:EAL domain-containing protein [Novosphingobium sp.]
ESYAPFAAPASRLIPAIRSAEARRPPLRERAGKNNIDIPSIQANTVARVGGQAYLLTATLVQPDFGKVLPKGPQAPITITALPLDAAFLKSFGERYLLDGLRLADQILPASGERTVQLRGANGRAVASLAWTPRQPGTMILEDFRVEALLALLGLFLVGLTVVRRGAAIVTELIASEGQARHLAYHDALTKLPNRALLFDRLPALLADPARNGRALAVICVDLDRFKDVNDTLGHHAGDLLIAAVAGRLGEVAEDTALIARLGGDEFVLLCEDVDRERAETLSRRILAAVLRPLETEHGRIEVGCSIGIALIDQPGLEPSEVLRWADLALYRSKERGRGQFQFFEPDMDAELRDRRALEMDLRRALASDGLKLVYHPQVDRQGRVRAVEGLLRWQDPRRGAIPPSRFVPLAEECGLILPLGEYVLRRIFAETAAWQCVRIAVNISAVQLRAPGFAAQVMRLAAQAGIDPARYEIELTETALLGDEPATAANVEALKRMGFSIALDDFGTGYSSLSVLQRFSVDRIKIDRSFVSDLGGTAEAEALVDAMIKLAKALGVSVVAEGVENAVQFNRLILCGCREFQGHLFGLPQGRAEIEAAYGLASPAADAAEDPAEETGTAEADAVKRRA